MKNLFLFIMMLAAVPLCRAQQVDSNANALYFPNDTLHDFGVIPEGPQAVYSFEFVNKGKEPMLLLDVVSSCGCLTPTYSKDPVMPGKHGYILLNYWTQGRPGNFYKTVMVRTNLQGKWKSFALVIKGEVVVEEERQTEPIK